MLHDHDVLKVCVPAVLGEGWRCWRLDRTACGQWYRNQPPGTHSRNMLVRRDVREAISVGVTGQVDRECTWNNKLIAVNLSMSRLLGGCCLVHVCTQYILALIRALESTSGYQLKRVWALRCTAAKSILVAEPVRTRWGRPWLLVVTLGDPWASRRKNRSNHRSIALRRSRRNREMSRRKRNRAPIDLCRRPMWNTTTGSFGPRCGSVCTKRLWSPRNCPRSPSHNTAHGCYRIGAVDSWRCHTLYRHRSLVKLSQLLAEHPASKDVEDVQHPPCGRLWFWFGLC